MNLAQIERLKKRFGTKKASLYLTQLGKSHQVVRAFGTDVGEVILTDALVRIDMLLHKIVDETATDVEKADYRALKQIVNAWSKRINDHYKLLKDVEEV